MPSSRSYSYYGYIINKIGDIPKSNENIVLKIDNVNIEVIKISNKRIEKVRVTYVKDIN